MKFVARVLQLALLFGIGFCSNMRDCKTPENVKEIDWARMKRIYYDVIDIPLPPTLDDCYNWKNFTPTDRGFTIYKDQWTTGKMTTETHFYEYIREKPGIYVLNAKYKKEVMDSTISTIKKLEAKDVDLKAEMEVVDDMYSWKTFFLTDYINYFMMVACTKKGWLAYIKSSYPEVDEVYATTVLGVLYRNGIFAPMFLKTDCMNIMKNAVTEGVATY